MQNMPQQPINMYNHGLANQRFMIGQQTVGYPEPISQTETVASLPVPTLGQQVFAGRPPLSTASSGQASSVPGDISFNIGEGAKVSDDNPFL